MCECGLEHLGPDQDALWGWLLDHACLEFTPYGEASSLVADAPLGIPVQMQIPAMEWSSR